MSCVKPKLENKEGCTKLCRGDNYFFWLPKNGGMKFEYKKLSHRIKPTNAIFHNALLICIECRSQRKVNNHMKGHVAMIYHQNKWDLMVIWKQTDEEIIVHPFVFTRSREKKIFLMKQKNYILKYVSLYISNLSYIKESNYRLEDFNNLATINLTDECLDAGISPTTIRMHPSITTENPELCQKRKAAGKGTTKKEDRKKKRRKKSRTKAKKMCKEWLTIYIPNHNPFGDISLSSKEPLMMVPEIGSETLQKDCPFSKQIFHAIHRDDLCELSGKLIPHQVTSMRKLSKGKFELVKFHHNEYPVRFSILKDSEFTSLKKERKDLKLYKDCSQDFFWNFSDEMNSSLPGIVVSMWDSLDPLKDCFPLKHYKRMQDRMGFGFGNRDSVPSGALCVYFGPNGSSRPLPSPIYGPGIRREVDYDRSYYHHDEFQQQLIKRINIGNNLLLLHARIIDRDYMDIIGEYKHPRKIWTQGVSCRKITCLDENGKLYQKTLQAGRYTGAIGFYCKLHYDPNDKLSEDESLTFIQNDPIRKKYKSKLSEMQESVGMGYPTTIGYNIYNPEKEIDILAFFVSWGFVTPITNQSFHHFYGWAFPHCSTFPFYIKKWLVTATNKGSCRNTSIYIGSFGINGRKI